MLACLSPAELVEIRAAYETIPLDDGWKQAGTIAAEIHNQLEVYFAMKAGKSRVDESRLFSPEDYIPRIKAHQHMRPVVNQASIDATQAILAQSCGMAI